MNRCLTEGRRSFLARYAGIESGEECERWAGTISAMVDGEATAREVAELRPHLRRCSGCRATVRELRESAVSVAAVLPVPVTLLLDRPEVHVSRLLPRLYEALADTVHERVAGSAVKVQAALDMAASGKVAAVAASAAAVAGGGLTAIERVHEHGRGPHARVEASAADRHARSRPASLTESATKLAAPLPPAPPAAPSPSDQAARSAASQAVREFDFEASAGSGGRSGTPSSGPPRASTAAVEFGG